MREDLMAFLDNKGLVANDISGTKRDVMIPIGFVMRCTSIGGIGFVH